MSQAGPGFRSFSASSSDFISKADEEDMVIGWGLTPAPVAPYILQSVLNLQNFEANP